MPPERDSADEYLDWLIAEVLPEAVTIAEAADVFLERGAFDAVQARTYLEAGRVASGSSYGCTATSSPRRARSRSRSSWEPARSTISRRRDLTACVRWRRAMSTGVLLPVSALFLGRPMPPGRALVDAGAAIALATDFNPGSAFCESLPLVCSLACTQLGLSPAQALAACTVNAAHVLGPGRQQRAARAGLRR